MALIEIKTDLSRVAKALERISEALERISPKPEENVKPSTEEDFHVINYEGDFREEEWSNYAPRRNY